MSWEALNLFLFLYISDFFVVVSSGMNNYPSLVISLWMLIVGHTPSKRTFMSIRIHCSTLPPRHLCGTTINNHLKANHLLDGSHRNIHPIVPAAFSQWIPVAILWAVFFPQRLLKVSKWSKCVCLPSPNPTNSPTTPTFLPPRKRKGSSTFF